MFDCLIKCRGVKYIYIYIDIEHVLCSLVESCKMIIKNELSMLHSVDQRSAAHQ